MLWFNQNEYVVSDFEIDNVNGEAILFNADSKIIMTLNSTATTIFHFLKENDKKRKLHKIVSFCLSKIILKYH